MGTYTNIYFENENFSINTKSLYPEDVLENFKKYGKIFYSYVGNEEDENVYLIFDDKDWDGYKHNVKFNNCGYNFFYNSKTNTLKIGVLNDFYCVLCDVSNFTEDFDILYSNLHEKIKRKYYNYQGIDIVDIDNYCDQRIAFIKDSIIYRIWITNNKITNIIVVNQKENTCISSRDFNFFDEIDYKKGRELFEQTKHLSLIEKFEFILQQKESKLIKDILTAYKEHIEPNLDILKEFLLKYNEDERIFIMM